MIRFLKSNLSYTVKPELANTIAKTIIIVGGKEKKKMRRSADILHRTIHDSKLQIFDAYYHGGLSINHPKDYAKLLNSLIETES